MFSSILQLALHYLPKRVDELSLRSYLFLIQKGTKNDKQEIYLGWLQCTEDISPLQYIRVCRRRLHIISSPIFAFVCLYNTVYIPFSGLQN